MSIRTVFCALTAGLLFAPSAFGYSPWVNPHNVCLELFSHDFGLPSPQVTNYIHPKYSTEDAEFSRIWGYINVFPGSNGERAGLWITGNGNTYFVELPPPVVSSDSVLGVTQSWELKVTTPDGRPPLVLQLHRSSLVNILGIRVFKWVKTAPGDRSYADAVPVSATMETSDEARQGSADALIRIVRHNQNDLSTKQAKLLSECSQRLDRSQADDAGVIDEIEQTLNGRKSLGSPLGFPSFPRSVGTSI
jgi:hypothetical protein